MKLFLGRRLAGTDGSLERYLRRGTVISRYSHRNPRHHEAVRYPAENRPPSRHGPCSAHTDQRSVDSANTGVMRCGRSTRPHLTINERISLRRLSSPWARPPEEGSGEERPGAPPHSAPPSGFPRLDLSLRTPPSPCFSR